MVAKKLHVAGLAGLVMLVGLARLAGLAGLAGQESQDSREPVQKKVKRESPGASSNQPDCYRTPGSKQI